MKIKLKNSFSPVALHIDLQLVPELEINKLNQKLDNTLSLN